MIPLCQDFDLKVKRMIRNIQDRFSKSKNSMIVIYIFSPVSLLNCSPNAITGSAEAMKMYRVGASILRELENKS